jgi:uroporphyrinogen decarboxylase
MSFSLEVPHLKENEEMVNSSRTLVEKTLQFDSPKRIPRHLWSLPWAEEHHADSLRQLRERFPDDIQAAPAQYHKPTEAVGDRYSKGTYIDEWGCTFESTETGTIGIVRKPRLADWQDMEDFSPPESTLSLDKDRINVFCRESEKFILSETTARPFERLQFLRTMEQALIDLIEQPHDLFELLQRIHAHYCKEIEVWAQTDIDGIALMDDWGTQFSLITSPEIFRQIFKPMYRDYVEIANHFGKYAFLHSDGYIMDVFPDFIEIGIDAINSQIFCMDLKELGKRFRGKITFWGEIDRQHLLPNGTHEDITQAVKEVKEELYENGGIIAQCEFGLKAKPENVIAVFETWDSFRF